MNLTIENSSKGFVAYILVIVRKGRVSILGGSPPCNSGTAGRNGMKIEPQVDGNNPFWRKNLVQIGPSVWALEGVKVLKTPKHTSGHS